MIYWFIICSALIVFCIIEATIIRNDVLDIVAFALVLVTIIVILATIVVRVNYNKFETQIELQREQYQELIERENNSSVILVEDIIVLNRELSEKKASRMYYNNWSLYPERVLDIKPIGLE